MDEDWGRGPCQVDDDDMMRIRHLRWRYVGDVARRRLVSRGNVVVGICDGLKETEISKSALLRAFTIRRGGKWVGLSASTGPRTTTTTASREVPSSFGLASSWGVLTTLAILFNSMRRLTPVALQPFKGYPPLTSFHWGMYLLSCITLAYAEGYKGFHQKFSPLVVKRALSLDEVCTKQGGNC